MTLIIKLLFQKKAFINIKQIFLSNL